MIVSEKLVDGLLWEYEVGLYLIGGYDQLGNYRCRIKIESRIFLSKSTTVRNLPGNQLY